MNNEFGDDDDALNEFSFLGNDRLMIVCDDLKLYSIEDMSQAPQLLMCILLPVGIDFVRPIHDSRPRMQAQQTMWISDPTRRLLSIATYVPSLVFVISTKTFFDPDLLERKAAAIPWKDWGPSNTRVFWYRRRCEFCVSDNRVLEPFSVSHAGEYRLRMMDFSPLAVIRRQDLGRVVQEPSTIVLASGAESITSSLPYVEVVSDRKFSEDDIEDIDVDRDRIYLFKRVSSYHFSSTSENTEFIQDQYEVIHI